MVWEVSATGLYPVLIGGRYGYVDKSGKTVIQAQFEFAQVFHGRSALVKENGKIGFIDQRGHYLIKPRFQQGSYFSNGLAAVSEHGNQYGYIDMQGKYVIKPDYYDAHPFTGPLAAVTQHKDRSAYFYIDRKGSKIIPGPYMFAGDFHHNLARVQKVIPQLADNDDDWKWGYIDTNGQFKIPAEYERAGDFIDTITYVFRRGKYYLIDIRGSIVAKSPYSIIFSPSEGLACVYKKRKYGYMNHHAKLVIPLRFDFCDYFQNGAAVVSSAGKYAVIDKSGHFIYRSDSVPWP